MTPLRVAVVLLLVARLGGARDRGLLPALWAVPACLAIAGLYVLGAGVAFARDAVWLPTTVPLLAELPFGGG